MPETLTVTYGRTFDDGHGGSESLSLSIVMELDRTEVAEEVLRDGTYARLAEKARVEVLRQLSRSESPRVAAAALGELTAAPGRAWANLEALAEERSIAEDQGQEDLFSYG